MSYGKGCHVIGETECDNGGTGAHGVTPLYLRRQGPELNIIDQGGLG